MKRLTLLRHAKSSWKDATLVDFDRPLNKRGKADAPLIGQRLAATGWCPDLVIASPAKRARKTAHLIAIELGYDLDAINYDDEIYEADQETLLKLLHAFRTSADDILLVGHNPGLTDLANLLAPCGLSNIVTCGVLALSFSVSTWREVGPLSGTFLFYDFPKKLWLKNDERLSDSD